MARWISVGCTATVLALTGVGGAGSTAAPPPLLGLTGGRVVALDRRTLTPLPSPRPLALSIHGSPLLALSPDGQRLAVVPRGNNSDDLVVVDRLRLRVVRTVRPESALLGDWDVAWGADGSIILVKAESYERGPVFGRCIPAVIGATDIHAGVVTRTKSGVVVLFGGRCGGGELVISPYTSDAPSEVDLALKLDPATPVAIAVDARRDRVFLISSTGAIAVVGLRTSRVQYHSVELPTAIDAGATYQAAWAGNGHLAIWGRSGLTLIDSRTWTAHHLDPAVTDVAVAPNALLAWSRNRATGLTFYKADGTLRDRLLLRRTVRSVRASARYGYVATSEGRFSVDLRTGRVTGPLTSRARLVLPDLMELP